METEIPAEARELIGVEKVREYQVTRRDIKRFAQVIGDPNPLYYDEEYARTTKHETIVAPPLYGHAFVFEDVPVEQLPPDGSLLETAIPIPAKRMMGGGSVYENYIRIRPGDKLQVKTRINDIYTKPGRSGVLYFIVVEPRIFNQNDELAAKETAVFIKRI